MASSWGKASILVLVGSGGKQRTKNYTVSKGTLFGTTTKSMSLITLQFQMSCLGPA